MFLATDIGNTNIVIAVHDGTSWKHKVRYETKDNQPAFYYETGLRDTLLEWGIAPDDIESAAISSVVPDITDKIVSAVAQNIRLEPAILDPELFLSLDMRIPKVYEIGSDLVANAYATRELYSHNSIIVDFGTALTFTIYDHNVGITGVTIAPGLRTIISTLSDSTSLLPQVDISLPDSAIGTSTSTAIRSGVLFGFVGMVRELLTRIKSELNGSYQVIATGGLSTALAELADQYDHLNKDLTLEGIRLLAQQKS